MFGVWLSITEVSQANTVITSAPPPRFALDALLPAAFQPERSVQPPDLPDADAATGFYKQLLLALHPDKHMSKPARFRSHYENLQKHLNFARDLFNLGKMQVSFLLLVCSRTRAPGVGRGGGGVLGVTVK